MLHGGRGPHDLQQHTGGAAGGVMAVMAAPALLHHHLQHCCTVDSYRYCCDHSCPFVRPRTLQASEGLSFARRVRTTRSIKASHCYLTLRAYPTRRPATATRPPTSA